MKTLIFYLLSTTALFAQKYEAYEGSITFFSDEILEDITAVNYNVQSILDADNGEVVFVVQIKDFEFEKSLMREHFNEKYMESDKFPKAIFVGKIRDFRKGQDKSEAHAAGELEIHGVKQNIEAVGALKFEESEIELHSKFMVKVKDYDIEIPSIMFQKIAEEIEITVDLKYRPRGN